MFYAHEDGRTQWDAPLAGSGSGSGSGDEAQSEGADEGLPEGWSKVTDEDGDTFYAHEDGMTQWDVPTATAGSGSGDGEADNGEAAGDEELPEGWSKVTDEDGDTFYAHEDGRTQWEPPESSDD